MNKKLFLAKLLSALKYVGIGIPAFLFFACSSDSAQNEPGVYEMPLNYKHLGGVVFEDLNLNNSYDFGEEIEDIKVTPVSDNDENTSGWYGIPATTSNGEYYATAYSDYDTVSFVFESAPDAAVKYKTKSFQVDFSKNTRIENYNVSMERDE